MIKLIFCLIFLASLLKCLKHANIVLLHDIIHTKETLTFVFEYMVSCPSSLQSKREKPGACIMNLLIFYGMIKLSLQCGKCHGNFHYCD